MGLASYSCLRSVCVPNGSALVPTRNGLGRFSLVVDFAFGSISGTVIWLNVRTAAKRRVDSKARSNTTRNLTSSTA